MTTTTTTAPLMDSLPTLNVPPFYLTTRPSTPPMLRYQASLPNLPVPSLKSTCAKYLETVRPLVTPEEFLSTRDAVEEFVASPQAAELQKLLLKRAERSDNWLNEWWDDARYMGNRNPLVVHVSYYFVHVDDRDRVRGANQAKRAASLVKAMLPFRGLAESGWLEPDMVRGKPLCMASYKWLFHASRSPSKSSDSARKYDAKSHNHIIVMRKNRFFAVPLTNSQGREITYTELEAQFKIIKALAGPEPDPIGIGAFTSDDRDHWADNRTKLIAASAKNADLLEKIESAMIIIALDDASPVTRDEVGWETWTGNARNRWYDKHQLVVFENGKSGFLGEHSCVDGTPTLRLNEFMLAAIDQGKIDLAEASSEAPLSLLPVEELKFEITPAIGSALEDAVSRYATLLADHDLRVFHFEGYGKNLMKRHDISPDAWAQLIKQLAFYKLEGRLGVCYENAQTRKFKLGRTEAIRSVSEQSRMWVEAMSVSPFKGRRTNAKALRELFRNAATAHRQYAAWAADGEGVDRHLFGLKTLVPSLPPSLAFPSNTLPRIFTDPAFSKSSHWELTTSQLSSPCFDSWGFGEVVPGGFGLSYSIGEGYVRWTVTSSRQGGRGREENERMVRALREAAEEVGTMMEDAVREDGMTMML